MLLILKSFILADEIQYEIYRVNSDATHTLITTGKKVYSSSDFLIHPKLKNDAFYRMRKELELSNGFSIGIIETYDHPKTGFGLWINRSSITVYPKGFSWEWFDQVFDGHFIKRQGKTPISIQTKMNSLTQEELIQVIFEADTKMRYKENTCNDKTKEKSKYITIIKAGSVLTFPSTSPNNPEEISQKPEVAF